MCLAAPPVKAAALITGNRFPKNRKTAASILKEIAEL
jgi:hypothetical protein